MDESLYAFVDRAWTGGPDSMENPDDQDPIVLSKKQLIEFGGADLEKLNFDVRYDVTSLNYRANLSIALIFDKSTLVSQTDLKGVQGEARATFRMPFLPKYDSKKKLGTHQLDIVLKIRPFFTVWHMLDSVRSFLELRSVTESTFTRTVILRE
jgi:hypothetical protein